MHDISRAVATGVLIVFLTGLAWPQDPVLPKAPEGMDVKKWWHAHALWFGRVYPPNHRARQGVLAIEAIWDTPEYREASLAYATGARGAAWVLDYLKRTQGMTVWKLWMYNRTQKAIRLQQFPAWKISILDDHGRSYKLIAWDALPHTMPPGATYAAMTIYSEEANREKFRSITLSFEAPESGEMYSYRWTSDIFDQYYKRDPSMIYWHMAAYWPEVLKKHLNLEQDVFPYWRNKYGLREGEPYPKPHP
ncbi:MAG: hypothetical protein QN198_06385 [Armatimonadota bacterium]|nr:hypothetical protein [Armatimonadota bacterium]MDR5703213.1 hypothetical protein [Armatimonadota bacterium]MDR7435508.1 hypothetical protein [Armatimonadota bacterium]